MSGSGCVGCCRCCSSFILTSGLTALFMWLSLRTSKPVCSVQVFYVPALNKSANYTSNSSVYFDIKLDNRNKDKGVYYDAINLTLYYGSNRSFPIASQTFPKFYQGHGKHTRRKSLVQTHGVRWSAVSNGSAVFRVNLTTAVRFKIMFWKTQKQKLVVGADVPVGDTGQKKVKKGIKLKSAAPELRGYHAPLGPLVIIFTSVVLSI